MPSTANSPEVPASVPVVRAWFTKRLDRSEFIASHFRRYLSGSVLDVGCDEGHLRRLVPGMQTPVFECYDIEGVLQVDPCQSADWVRVTVSAVFQPSLPLLTFLGTLTVSSTSSAEIQ